MSQSVCPARFNCQSADAWEPNSDIAGLGVLIGFVGTGYLVFALLVVHYLVAYEPELPPPRQTLDDERPSQAASPEHLRANPPDVSAANIVTHTDPVYWEPNPIDVNLLAWVRSWTAKLLAFLGASLPLVGQATSEHISRCFNKCIIAMCDVQIVTGMSILIGGFMCLDGNLSALHWQIIIYLAWFSCVTHLSGLTVLRRYFQTHPREKSLRITLMFVLLIILVIAIIPSGFFNWTSPRANSSLPQPTAASAKTSAACFYNLNCAKQLYQDSLAFYCSEVCTDAAGNPSPCHLVPTRDFDCRWLTESSAMQEMIISTVLLFFGFVSRTFKLSTHVSIAFHRKLVLPVSNYAVYCLIKLEDLVPASETHLTARWHVRTLSRKAWQTLLVRPLLAVVMLVSTHFNLFNSMLGELSWLLAILLWGTSKVMSAHYDEEYYTNKHVEYHTNDHEEQHQDEEHSPKWEFGQVLPVLLLAAPLVAVIGTFTSFDKSDETAQPSPRLGSLGFGTMGGRSTDNQQSDANTWELTSLSVPETNLGAQSQESNIPSRAETANIELTIDRNQRISGRNVFAKDHYSKTLWMSPYILSSFLVVWIHVFFLFWFATDAFLLPGVDTSQAAGKMKNSLDYLFEESTGVFYLVLASYPVACHSTILYGLTLDHGTNARLATAPHSSRKVLFWLGTLIVHLAYASLTYLTFDVDKNFFFLEYGMEDNVDNGYMYRLPLLGYIGAGLYGLYLLVCLVHRATT